MQVSLIAFYEINAFMEKVAGIGEDECTVAFDCNVFELLTKKPAVPFSKELTKRLRDSALCKTASLKSLVSPLTQLSERFSPTLTSGGKVLHNILVDGFDAVAELMDRQRAIVNIWVKFTSSAPIAKDARELPKVEALTLTELPASVGEMVKSAKAETMQKVDTMQQALGSREVALALTNEDRTINQGYTSHRGQYLCRNAGAKSLRGSRY